MANAPLRFEVLVNGKVVATTGVGAAYGVLSAIVTWVRRNPAAISAKVRADPDFDELTFLNEVCEVELGALDSVADQHSSWGKHGLRPGDEVTIRVLPSGQYDAPTAA
jgi:hypothetical protein